MGYTPSGQLDGLTLPPHRRWWVEVEEPLNAEECDALGEIVRERGIPGLVLGDEAGRVLAAAPELPGLHTLELRGRWGWRELKALEKAPNLTGLRLHGPKIQSDDVLKYLPQLPWLDTLVLEGFAHPLRWVSLERVPRLVRLCVSGGAISRAALRLLDGAPLRSLGLLGVQFEPSEDLFALGNCEALEELAVWEGSGVGRLAVYGLLRGTHAGGGTGLLNLRSLTLDLRGPTEARWFQSWEDLQGLRQLRLRAETGFEPALAQLPALVSLGLRYRCSCAPTARTLPHVPLPLLQSVRTLSISSRRCAPVGWLERCPSLESLDLLLARHGVSPDFTALRRVRELTLRSPSWLHSLHTVPPGAPLERLRVVAHGLNDVSWSALTRFDCPVELELASSEWVKQRSRLERLPNSVNASTRLPESCRYGCCPIPSEEPLRQLRREISRALPVTDRNTDWRPRDPQPCQYF